MLVLNLLYNSNHYNLIIKMITNINCKSSVIYYLLNRSDLMINKLCIEESYEKELKFKAKITFIDKS